MEDIIIQCETKEQFEKIKNKWKEKGLDVHNHSWFEKYNCIRWSDGNSGVGDREYYERSEPNIPIVKAEEYLNERFKDLPAKEQGIDTSRYFYVVEDDYREGDILTISIDDNSEYPFFDNVATGRKAGVFYWRDLRYATQEEIEEATGEDRHSLMEAKKAMDCIIRDDIIDRKTFEFNLIKKTMNKVTNFIKNAGLSVKERTFRKYGFKDECGRYTEAFEEVRDLLLNQEMEDKVYAELEKTLKEEEK